MCSIVQGASIKVRLHAQVQAMTASNRRLKHCCVARV